MLQKPLVWVRRSFAMGGGPITVPQVMWTVGVRPNIANFLLGGICATQFVTTHRKHENIGGAHIANTKTSVAHTSLKKKHRLLHVFHIKNIGGTHIANTKTSVAHTSLKKKHRLLHVFHIKNIGGTHIANTKTSVAHTSQTRKHRWHTHR